MIFIESTFLMGSFENIATGLKPETLLSCAKVISF